MDLIYTNAAREDQGVLFDYEFDLAFGADENNFQCTIPLNAHCMEPGSFLYIEGTEYGGIVDFYEVDTDKQQIKYTGRTWHGILAGKVIEPEPGYDYYVATGDANTVIGELIEYLGLPDLFSVVAEESEVQVVNYAFHRYTDAYSGIKKMLFEFGGKLQLSYQTDRVVLSAVKFVDYSYNDEFDASQVDFTVAKNFRPVNHLICLGSGNLKNRHVIHLFADNSGVVQPYKKVEQPISDDDYILDKSGQVLFDIDEVADVYDYSSAQITENYVVLDEQPGDWASNYANYYTLDENGFYSSVEGVSEEVRNVLTSQPSDWETNYANYFYQADDGTVKTAESVVTHNYKPQGEKPSDWETNYANYYTYFNDGVTEIWEPVESERAYRYVLQTMKPTDWETNYEDYYFSTNGIRVSGVRKVKYVDKNTGKKVFETVAPIWCENRYYTAYPYYTAPKWMLGLYYTLHPNEAAPVFESGKFYTVQTVIVNPAFAQKKYFELKLDHFAEMLTGALEKMDEFFNCDSISIDLDIEGMYDIGDVVGATEHVTGVAVWQPISKKIVSISNGIKTVNYEIGGI